MNNTLPNITPAQAWIADTRLRMARIGSNIANILTELQVGFDDLWRRKDEEINVILAEVGNEAAMTILTLHYQLGTALNPVQAALADAGLAARISCATAKPRELTINSSGLLELVPLPEPEPPPDPEPTLEPSPEPDPQPDPEPTPEPTP